MPILGLHHAASSCSWINPGKERCSAESSERSSLATTPEPRRDRLGSLPTPRPRFPPPSTSTVGHLLAPGQTHWGNLSLCFDRWPRDQGRPGRPADATNLWGAISGFLPLTYRFVTALCRLSRPGPRRGRLPWPLRGTFPAWEALNLDQSAPAPLKAWRAQTGQGSVGSAQSSLSARETAGHKS